MRLQHSFGKERRLFEADDRGRKRRILRRRRHERRDADDERVHREKQLGVGVGRRRLERGDAEDERLHDRKQRLHVRRRRRRE
ncbi:hypothetical protein SDC9_187005 [bioreactor metagenome]|uniref:Uncharacterized protein n=1 Tax=bioreactor metagenome TaxID=1076179 RepID=A0A645HKF6_9ZZZZ